MTNLNFKDIIAKAKEITQSGLPFMQGREKGESDRLLGAVVTITEFGFMEGDDGEYAVILVKEDNKHFYNGSSVLTDSLKKLQDALTDEELKELLENGLPVLHEKRKSKNKKDYFKPTFFPEEN